MRKLSILLISALSYICSSAQTGNIKGTVKTSDGQPAELLNIVLKGTDKGASANSKGEFEIYDIEVGTYILAISFIGLETKEEKVEVKAGKTTVVPEITLKENSQQLKEVMITAYKSNNEKEVIIGKAPIKPMDLP